MRSRLTRVSRASSPFVVDLRRLTLSYPNPDTGFRPFDLRRGAKAGTWEHRTQLADSPQDGSRRTHVAREALENDHGAWGS